MKEKNIKLAALVISFIISTKVVWALEPVSYRIKSLGSDLQGIVEDEYTDLLANPARIGQMNKKQLYGKIGYSARPLTLGFIGKNFGLVAEGSELLNRGGDSYKYQRYQSDVSAWYIRDSIDKRTYQSESIDVYLIKGFSLRNKAFGIALLGQKNLIVDNYYYEYDYFYKSDSGYLIYQYKSSNERKEETDSRALKLLLGSYSQVKREKEQDFVLYFSLRENKTINLQRDYSYRDDDPDGDGKNYYGYNIPTLNYEWSLDEVKTESSSKPEFGAGIEYRSRKKINENVKSAFLAGISGSFKKLEVEEALIDQTYRISGTTVSTTGSQSITPSPRDTGTGNVFVTLGRSIKIKDKFLISYGLRTDFSYDGETYVLTGRLVFPLGVEYEILPILMFRSGVSVIFTGTGKHVSVVHPDGARTRLYTDTFEQNASYSAGFGLKPYEQLLFDFFTTGDMFNISNWQLQVSYLF